MIMKVYKQGTLIVIYNSMNEFLLQKRDYNPSIKYPGKWVFLGGGIKPGEKPEDAIKRELIEEINLAVDDVSFYGNFRYSDSEEEHLQYVFHKSMDLDLAGITLNEGTELRYFSRQDAQTLEFGFNIKHIFDDYYLNHYCLKK